MTESDKDLLEKTMRLPKWAVVGASPKPERYSYKIMQILRDRGYQVMLVRPGLEEIDGLPCYPTLLDLPEPPDVVDMVVNPEIGIETMKHVKQLGIRYVWLQPGSESAEILQFARDHDIVAFEACILASLKIRPDFRVVAEASDK